MRKFWVVAMCVLLSSATVACNGPEPAEDVVMNVEQNGGDDTVQPPESELPIDGGVPEVIDLSLNPDESGRIMILMYHGIGDEESEWQRTPDNFRRDLQYLYDNDFRIISLNDYARGHITTEAGKKPVVLTFDDGRQNNFSVYEESGKISIDKDCAIGILEEFKEKYEDFCVTASFFVGSNIFGQPEYADYKVNWLIDNGYDIGNHTYSHDSMKNLNSEEIQKEIGLINDIIASYSPDYSVETIALPNGSRPVSEYLKYVVDGEYNGKSYRNIAILNVGAEPAFSPFSLRADFASLSRVRASEINVENFGMYSYLEGSTSWFISDGDPDTVTIPAECEQYIDVEALGGRKLNIYEPMWQ